MWAFAKGPTSRHFFSNNMSVSCLLILGTTELTDLLTFNLLFLYF